MIKRSAYIEQMKTVIGSRLLLSRSNTEFHLVLRNFMCMVSSMILTQLTAIEAVQQIVAGKISSEDLLVACLKRIDDVNADVKAWAHLDRDFALKQARQRDSEREIGKACGSLHGLPVGIKDIFDTRDMPTENGTQLHAGRQPNTDATVVSLLRAAGAVIMGKTVTTELAVYAPGETRNPLNFERTPGGSSSGSAAAVASGMVPLAIGTQTNGSIIRPASYCGIFGLKPTYGAISCQGVLSQSSPLDTIGVMARSIGDIALIAESLMTINSGNPAMLPRSPLALINAAIAEPPVEPKIAFVKSSVWSQADDEYRYALTEISNFLGACCDEVNLTSPFDHAIDLHRTIMCADLAKSFAGLYETGKDQLSDTLVNMIEEGQKVLIADYSHALDRIQILYARLEKIFDKYDAIMSPAVTGEAPHGLEATGSPVFCTLWTLLGTPALSLPLLKGSNGMPMGVQLIGARWDDARLLQTANWLIREVAKKNKCEEQ